MRRFLVAAVLLTAALPALAWADDPAAIVKQRQDLMASFFPKYLRAMAAAGRGDASNLAALPDLAQDAAVQIRKVPALFPPGTGRDVVPSTRAKPEIWTNRAQFEANVATLAAAVEKFGDVAKTGDEEAVKAQWTVVAQACGACHGGPAKSGGPFRFEGQ